MQTTEKLEIVFKEWVRDHADALYQFAYHRVNDEELSKDLVQDSFLAAWKNMESYRGEVSARNWLFIILKRKIIDHYRKAGRHVEELLNHEKIEDHFFDEADHWRKGSYPRELAVNFTDRTESQDFQNIFRSCSSKLKTLHKAVFTMKYIDGMESDEICETLGLKSNNFWVLMHRAKLQLRACLEKNWIK